MKTLPPPPQVVDSKDIAPAARSIHFLKDNSLLVSYLEHGIVYVGEVKVPVTWFNRITGVGTSKQCLRSGTLFHECGICVFAPSCLLSLPHRLTDALPGSGRSCVSPDGKFVVVSNMYDGVDFYSISTHAFSHTIQYRVNPHMNSPIPVEFFPDGQHLLIGGTHGSARTIDVQTSETIQLLPHAGEYEHQPIIINTEPLKVISFKR
jgi:hypothetical protein